MDVSLHIKAKVITSCTFDQACIVTFSALESRSAPSQRTSQTKFICIYVYVQHIHIYKCTVPEDWSNQMHFCICIQYVQQIHIYKSAIPVDWSNQMHL